MSKTTASCVRCTRVNSVSPMASRSEARRPIQHHRGEFAKQTDGSPSKVPHNATFFTIGHSNRDLSEFVTMLEENAVTHLVDVRRLPGSHRYPHFNADSLADALAEHDIGFTRLEGLTGRRPVSKDVA